MLPLQPGHNVWIDWPADDRLLTFENYKCLESLLSLHPSARFTVLLPASSDAGANGGPQPSVSQGAC